VLKRLRLFVLLLGVLYASPARAETVIAFWDFNAGFDVSDETAQITHAPTLGSGILYQQRADTDGNGKGGVAFDDVGLGISVPDGRAIAWDDIAKSGDNDAELFMVFSTAGLSGIQIRFDVLGNGEGNDEIVSYDLKYDLNPLVDVTGPDGTSTIKDFAGGLSTSIFDDKSLPANGTSFISETIDLSGVKAIDNQPLVAIRLDDFEENEKMVIDNVLITSVSAIPEPSSATFLALMLGLGSCRRARRD